MPRQFTPPATEIAALWRRCGAIVYDSVVLIAIWMLSTFLVTAAFGIDNFHRENYSANFLLAYRTAMLLALLASAWLFFGWFWTFSGQTLGMQAWKIRVQNRDGSAISWRQASLRYATAPFALALLGIGYLWMLGDGERRTWPDIASGSTVVTIRKLS
ncbi:MAG TPA: RDD family protein [Candidatus Acidoferrum sp.]|nr:RDD family protein [Candidatus Acidoferrum sp.]